MKVAIDVVLANKLTTNQWGVKLGKVPAKRILPEPTVRYCGMKGN